MNSNTVVGIDVVVHGAVVEAAVVPQGSIVLVMFPFSEHTAKMQCPSPSVVE